MAVLTTAAAILFFPSAAGAEVLYDQTDHSGTPTADPSGQNFAPSNDFPGSSYDLVADDFVVPAGQTWSINEVDVFGTYGGDPPPAVNVYIFANGSGGPGSKLFEQIGVTASGGPNYRVPLLVPTLGPGAYWIAVQQAGAEFGGAALWSWTTRTLQTGNAAHSADSSYVGGSCVPDTWYPRLSCWTGSNPDQVFRIQGVRTGGPTDPPPPDPPSGGGGGHMGRPTTQITKRPKDSIKTSKRKIAVRYAFRANRPGAKFRCRFDDKRFAPCSSPAKFKASKGRHKFAVAAVVRGRTDRTPATDSFRVKRK